jgi:hypothetical protein
MKIPRRAILARQQELNRQTKAREGEGARVASLPVCKVCNLPSPTTKWGKCEECRGLRQLGPAVRDEAKERVEAALSPIRKRLFARPQASPAESK